MQDNGAQQGTDDGKVNEDPAQSVSTDAIDGVDAHAGNDATANVAALNAALTQAQAQVAALKEDFLRAKAETENVRRRSQEDVAKAHKFGIESFAENLLPVADSLEAALADQSADLAKVREGVELTLRQLSSALEKGKIGAIAPAVGEKFDPHRHQAISMVPAEQDPNTVVTLLQKGYVIAERVLRPALVMVAAPK